MGIYIKGMEMPQEGTLWLVVHTDGTVEHRFNSKWDKGWVATKNAAVPVPPHGDLIDRDALPTSRVEWEDIEFAPTIIKAEEGDARLDKD